MINKYNVDNKLLYDYIKYVAKEKNGHTLSWLTKELGINIVTYRNYREKTAFPLDLAITMFKYLDIEFNKLNDFIICNENTNSLK